VLSSNTSSTCLGNMVNFGPLTAEIASEVWAPLQISTSCASWQRYCMALYSSGHQPNVAALNRGRHLYSAGRPSRWALAHILVVPMLFAFVVLGLASSVGLLSQRNDLFCVEWDVKPYLDQSKQRRSVAAERSNWPRAALCRRNISVQ